MTNRIPTEQRVVLPLSADVDMRVRDGLPALVVTAPDGGTITLAFPPGHPGDVAATLSAMAGAVRDAEQEYMTRELQYLWEQEQEVVR
ncbi:MULTISPECIES: hypothetical protein [unclassified Nocardiopsis]|uniref:hypothetical protein n=1 Tax=Nocardiopsis TaxID=2013 RepID=UPI00387AC64E